MLEKFSGPAEFYGGVRGAVGNSLDHRGDSWMGCLCQMDANSGKGEGPKARRAPRPDTREDRKPLLGKPMTLLHRLLGLDLRHRIQNVEQRTSALEETMDDLVRRFGK